MALTLRKLGSGKYGDVFLVSNGRVKFALRVSFYRDDTIQEFTDKIKRGDEKGASQSKASDAISVSNEFGKFVRSIMDTVSPHFVYVYESIDVKDFARRLPFMKERLEALTPLQKRYNNLSMMEAFTCDATKYLQRFTYDEATLRALVFQVVYTIAAMQHVLPGWRHNDLSTNNVLVKKLKRPWTASYDVRGIASTFFTEVPVLVGITDYDFLHVPGRRGMENFRVTSGRFRVDQRKNLTYDVHFFLKSVLRCISKKSQEEFPETTRFFKSLKLKKDDRQDDEIPGIHPLAILKNPYFDPLKSPPPSETVESRFRF